ncbi:hypothetical protein ACKVMT_06220 [Halobacteriales archaeon Cl-PHB]
MGTVTTSLRQRARSIFDELGYDVSNHAGEIRAERKWRVVQVTPMAEPGQPPASGELRCFVTWNDRLDALEAMLRRADPDYEWAIIGVDETDEYEVCSRQAV